MRPRQLRIAVLLLALVLTGAWAFGVKRSRLMRNDWSRTLQVAVVLLEPKGSSNPGLELMKSRLPELAERLATEARRYRSEIPPPFQLTAFGPIALEQQPPLGPSEDGVLARLRHGFALRRALGKVDAQAGLQAGFDARIYLWIEAPQSEHSAREVEGIGAKGGEIGLVRVTMDAEMVDHAMLALAHELFHCLGATDKYDPNGHAIDPEGLAEPELRPRYPQQFAELMVGEIPIAPGQGRLALSLSELRVGPLTAQEIGWRLP